MPSHCVLGSQHMNLRGHIQSIIVSLGEETSPGNPLKGGVIDSCLDSEEPKEWRENYSVSKLPLPSAPQIPALSRPVEDFQPQGEEIYSGACFQAQACGWLEFPLPCLIGVGALGHSVLRGDRCQLLTISLNFHSV